MSSTPSDLRAHIDGLLRGALNQVAPDAAGMAIVIERPKSLQHGDYASSVAMQLAKAANIAVR